MRSACLLFKAPARLLCLQVRGFMLDGVFNLVSHGPLKSGMKKRKPGGAGDDDDDDDGGVSDRNMDSYSIGVKTILVVPLCWCRCSIRNPKAVWIEGRGLVPSHPPITLQVLVRQV